MIVFKFCEPAYAHCHPDFNENVYLMAGIGGNFVLNRGQVIYEEYLKNDQRFNFYKILGDVYRRYLISDKCVYLKDDGRMLEIKKEILDAIFPYYPLDREENVFLATIPNYPKRFKSSLAVLNCELECFIYKEVRSISDTLINGFVYGFDVNNKNVFKFDINLKAVWVYEPSFDCLRAKTPILIDNRVVIFIGPKLESRQLIKGRGQYTCSGGVLVGLNDADGSLAWERDMPNAVDNYQLVDDILYVASLNEILLINPDDGELINTIDTETSVPFDRNLGPSVYVDSSFIYYSHYDDAVILIYDVNTLALLRRIELPGGYYARGHNFHDEVSGKQYFTLANRTQYVAQGPVLEIDPQNLDEELEFEQEPDTDIQLKTSPENPDEKELVIKLTSESLDDALRFGEIYTRDEAQRYSYNYTDMTFQDRPFTPEKNFNGVIRFIYSGCCKDSDTVNAHLRVMEKRFEKWNESEGFFSCVDKHKPTRLVAEYIKSD